ncbi:MAG: hypothetical protein JO063_05150 [Pseudonocardiales bacterium]|nr:hypothetical protein [Pseudonocardiales bacterium]MBV9030004.1 hypothetical protein [Pseudonocardiales bacterium]MBW0009495.1 hypothetical protein [Pseudonocardiales bacterium]
MRSEPQPDPPDTRERRRLDDDLVGLDRDDPEVRAFSEHLDRLYRQRPGFTVESYLSGVSDFAESANRAQGSRRAAAVLVVALILLGVAVTLWEATTFILGTLLG